VTYPNARQDFVQFKPVTAETWADLDRLFSDSAGEEHGNPSRCWCMEWRLDSHDEWRTGADDGSNRDKMRGHVGAGFMPGIVAYVEDVPAAWISVSPRTDLIGMRQHLENADAPDVWSIICVYIAEPHRGQGLMRALIEAAVAHAALNGARTVEGYPFVREMADDGAGGTVETFEQAGFQRVAEIRPGQWTMRFNIQPQSP
jgi:GNAT superfamily N-acetyltransferase